MQIVTKTLEKSNYTVKIIRNHLPPVRLNEKVQKYKVSTHWISVKCTKGLDAHRILERIESFNKMI